MPREQACLRNLRLSVSEGLGGRKTVGAHFVRIIEVQLSRRSSVCCEVGSGTVKIASVAVEIHGNGLSAWC